MTVSVSIPSQLTAYTDGLARVAAAGTTVAGGVVDEQDRVRKHMRMFIGLEETRSVAAPIRDGDELLTFGALSGG